MRRASPSLLNYTPLPGRANCFIAALQALLVSLDSHCYTFYIAPLLQLLPLLYQPHSILLAAFQLHPSCHST